MYVLGGSIRTEGKPRTGAALTFGAGWIRIFNNPKRYPSNQSIKLS